MVTQRFSPGPEGGFNPGILVVPETRVLFLGAGERILTYELSGPERLSEESVFCGFWRWSCHGDRIVMSGELELTGWSTEGHEVWSYRYDVEPPWSFEVQGGRIIVDVMGERTDLDLMTGQRASV